MDTDDLLPLIIGLTIAAGLFFGFKTFIKKSVYAPPPKTMSESQELQKEQKWRVEDVRRRQKELMRSQQQKIKDMQR